jgi:hypothetical protein
MQDRYAGDCGDYAKVKILNAFKDWGLTVGVNWYKVSDLGFEKKTDGSFKQADGKHRFYDDVNSIADLEKKLPGMVFFDEEVPVEGRSEWHQRAREALKDCKVVFLDPDNGIRCKSVGKTSKRSVKYVLHDEIKDYLADGKTVIVYNHRCRKKETKYFKDIYDLLLKEGLDIEAEDIGIITFRKGTTRDFLIFNIKNKNWEHFTEVRFKLATLLDDEDTWKTGVLSYYLDRYDNSLKVRDAVEPTKYYLIRDRIIGKRENGCDDYLLKDGKWVDDEKHVIGDHLIGYDPDPFYGIGNMEIMDEIKEISKEDAIKRVINVTMDSRKWNHMIRMVNDNDPRSKAEKEFLEEEMTIFDNMKAELAEMRRENPRAAFWPVETDW